MAKFRNYIGIIFILTLLFSCGDGRTDNNPTTKQETPKALQDDKLEIKSYSRSGSDLTEELYQDLVDKSPELKKLEDDFDALRSKPSDLNKKFDKYNNKSNSYYSSADNKAAAITDSLLKKKILALITSSKDKYSTMTAELNSLLKQISENGGRLNDHHAVLKIVLTLPIIEKYQNDNLPEKKEFKELMKQQENLIERTDSLTPGY